MYNSLPPIAANMRQTSEMLGAIVPETEEIRECISDIVDEFFADTADEALSRFERDLGLKNAAALSLAQRRDRVRAALIMTGESCTPAALQEILERISGVSISVIEHPEDYAIEIAFNDTYGTPRFLEDIKAAVKKFKPAHILDIYTFLYKLVSDYYEDTLSDLYQNTLEEMEE